MAQAAPDGSTLRFFTAMFSGLQSYRFGEKKAHISLWEQPGKGSAHFTDIATASDVATAWSARGRDVYVGVNLRDSDLGASKRGGKRNIFGLTGFFLDLDIGTIGHKADNCPPTMPDAVELLEAVGHAPTMLVDSGGGLHAYYLFNDIVWVTDPGIGKAYEQALIALQERVISAARARGWTVDNTAEMTRALRVPGTINRKVPGFPRPVVLLDDQGPRCNFTEMLISLKCAPPATGTPVSGPPALDPLAGATPSTSNVGASAPVGGAGPAGPAVSLADLTARLMNLKDPVRRATWGDILAGRSFASVERDRAMQSAAATAAWLAPDNDPDDIAELFRPSLTLWAAESTATKSLEDEMDKVRDKIVRAQDDARAERARQAAEDAAILQVFETKSAPPPPVAIVPGVKKGQYTDEELSDLANLSHCTVEELKHVWMVQKGQSYFVLTDTGDLGPRYAGPFQRSELKVALPQYLVRAPVQWYRIGAKGQPVDKDVDEMMVDYCAAAEHIEASLTIQTSYFDTRTRTFHEAVRPLRRLEPVNHPDVQAWLMALGGANAGKLLDWIATVTLLEKQTCALYMSGPPGTGKTLLANGLARLWTTKGVTELGRILDNFNEDLCKCPLIFADEALPSNQQGKQTSAKLRELIGSPTRTLSRKFIANASIHGCIRLILAANNERLLAFNEDMTPDDMKAMAERFLHIDTAPAAAYLEGLGGPVHVEGWIEQDRIAEHALWLKATRAVAPAGRWLVAGHSSRVHQSIATRGTLQGLVTEWLVKYLERPSPGIPSGSPIRVGGGQFVVNTAVVSTYWEQYIRSDKTPDTARVGRILKGLGTGKEVRLGGVRCHEIDLSALYAWAAENQVGEPEKLKERVNQPVLVQPDTTKPVLVDPPATLHDLNASIEKATKESK